LTAREGEVEGEGEERRGREGVIKMCACGKKYLRMGSCGDMHNMHVAAQASMHARHARGNTAPCSNCMHASLCTSMHAHQHLR